jgi:hypothetical protein
MERRIFFKRLFSILVIGGLLLLGGCGEKEKPAGFGNQERLWELANGEVKAEEPVEPAYAKKTPAFYRDASLGKAGPNFVPKVSGG